MANPSVRKKGNGNLDDQLQLQDRNPPCLHPNHAESPMPDPISLAKKQVPNKLQWGGSPSRPVY